jgi:hypothetical protein
VIKDAAVEYEYDSVKFVFSLPVAKEEYIKPSEAIGVIFACGPPPNSAKRLTMHAAASSDKLE